MTDPTAYEAARAPSSLVLRSRSLASDADLMVAVRRFWAATQALTPAAQIAARPLRWLLGAFVAGVALGWVTFPSPRSSRGHDRRT